MNTFPISNPGSASAASRGVEDQIDAEKKPIVKFINIDGRPQALEGMWGRDGLFHTSSNGVEMHFYRDAVFDDAMHPSAQQTATPAWRADKQELVSALGSRRHSTASLAAMQLLKTQLRNTPELETDLRQAGSNPTPHVEIKNIGQYPAPVPARTTMAISLEDGTTIERGCSIRLIMDAEQRDAFIQVAERENVVSTFPPKGKLSEQPTDNVKATLNKPPIFGSTST